MMVLSNIINFIKYWYFRYLLITELYMVENWERTTVHLIIALMFFGLWFFNTAILLNAVEHLTRGRYNVAIL